MWELAFAADLPHEYTVTDAFGNRTAHTLTWRTAHELPVEGPYEPVTVTDGNAASYPSAPGNGVYYVLLTDLSFQVNTRRGTQAIDKGVRELLDTSLTLHVETDREKREYLLGSLITREVTYIEDTDTADGICNDVLQISPTWKYNLDGSLIEYRLSARCRLAAARRRGGRGAGGQPDRRLPQRRRAQPRRQDGRGLPRRQREPDADRHARL